MKRKCILFISLVLWLPIALAHGETVRIGFNYPQTGPLSAQGQAQLNAARIAVEELNQKSGILGRKVELVTRDSQSQAPVSKNNVIDLIEKEGCEMIFGGASSAVAIAGGMAARSKGKLYFATVAASNSVTGKHGHKYMFRECYNSWMGAKALGTYMAESELAGHKFFYITANYTWGLTTEESIRKFSLTTNEKVHRRSYIPFPGATYKDFHNALAMAKAVKPDVLVLVLFGKDLVRALTLVEEMGIKKKVKAIVATLDLGSVASAGPEVMEGVIGVSPWFWKIPFLYDHPEGQEFVKKYVERYQAYPSMSSASAYTNLHQYAQAVERAKTFESKAVIAALEGHKFTSLKGEQQWRAFDHQALQTVYTVRCKPAPEVKQDKFKQDYFEVIGTMDATESARTEEEWLQARTGQGKLLEF